MHDVRVRCSGWVLVGLWMLLSCVDATVFSASPALPNGAVTGTVQDEKGAPLAGVLVSVMSPAKGTSTSVISGRSGTYVADGLVAGSYEVRGERKGFETALQAGIVVQGRATVNLVLKPQRTRPVQLTSSEVFDQFPDDPDKPLMVNTCFRCHSMLNLVSIRKDQAGWEKTIRTMYARRWKTGTDETGFANPEKMSTHVPERKSKQASEDEIQKLTNYFVKHFNTGRPAPPPILDEPEPPVGGAAAIVREFRIPDQGKPEVAVPSMNSAVIYPHNITVTPEGTVWFAMYKANKIGRLDPAAGEFSAFPVPTPGAVPHGVTYAADGSIWFTEARGSKVGKLDPKTGQIREVATNAGGNTIARDSKGNMYVTMGGTNQIGKVNTKTFESTAYDIPTPNSQPYGIIVDQKDQVWWCELFGDSIGKLDPATGKITEYPTPTKLSGPRRLAVDRSGTIWFTEWLSNKVGELDPNTGKIVEYDLPTASSEPYEVAVEADDTVWVAGYLSNKLARFDRVRKIFVEYPIPTRRGEIRKMAADPQHGIWFAESHTDTIGHIVIKK